MPKQPALKYTRSQIQEILREQETSGLTLPNSTSCPTTVLFSGGVSFRVCLPWIWCPATGKDVAL